MTKKKQISGGAHLMKKGKKPMLLGLTLAQHTLIKQAATKSGQYMTQFVLHHAIIAAWRVS